MKKQLWMINVRPVINGQPAKLLTHIAFYDKVKGETADQFMERVIRKDKTYRVMFLTLLAKIFGGADSASFTAELKKNAKRAKNKRKSVDDILIGMIGVDTFKVYVCSCDEEVRAVDMSFTVDKKKK